VLWQLKSLAHKNLAQKLLLGFFFSFKTQFICIQGSHMLKKKNPPGSQWLETDPCV